MENFQKDFLEDQSLQVDHEVRQQFLESAKWAKFISISVFVIFGLLLIGFGIGGSTVISQMQTMDRFADFAEFGGGMGVGIIFGIIIVAFAIFGVVYYFLYNFAEKIKTALATDNTELLNKGLSSLKIFFIITAIFSIISLLGNLSKLF